jgi:hypothetical protein
MTWGQWMVVEFSVEEELRLENQCRSAYRCEDIEQLAHLCSSLVKQNAYYTKLVRQATGHIAELEMIITFGDSVKLSSESDDSGQIDQDDTRVQNPFVNVLLIILGIVMELGEFCFGLLRRVMPTKNRENRDSAS